MARNKVIDVTRSKAFKNRSQEEHTINDFSLDLSHERPDPHEEMELNERAKKVKQALSMLKK